MGIKHKGNSYHGVCARRVKESVRAMGIGRMEKSLYKLTKFFTVGFIKRENLSWVLDKGVGLRYFDGEKEKALDLEACK